MLRKLLTLLAVLVACASATVSAQTAQTATRSMTLTITPFLSCTGTRDLDWGTHRRIDGPLVTSSTSFLEWICDTDPNASINITFGLPDRMLNPSATGLPVWLSYGNQSGYADQNGVAFDPASGLANDIVPTGHVVITIGKPRLGGAAELIIADIASASPLGGGHYSAVVVLTVSSN